MNRTQKVDSTHPNKILQLKFYITNSDSRTLKTKSTKLIIYMYIHSRQTICLCVCDDHTSTLDYVMV